MRFGAAFFLFCAAIGLASCDDGGNTTIVEGITLVGNFPGTEITEYLVSDDGRAFNHSGAKVNKGIQVFWNASNGHAIVLYLDGWERFWAHHWNGTRFTPGVELRGANQQDITQSEENQADNSFQNFGAFRVLFLNTSTGGRNGDAIILWTRQDAPIPGSSTDTVENRRLYGTYFDVSESGNPTSVSDATVHYGFESQGTTIDFNNSNDNVDCFGFVSDSLMYTHAFDQRSAESIEWPNQLDDGSEDALTPATRSGDPTSFVFIVWNKDQKDFVSVGPEDRFHALQFSLGQVGNAIPTQGSAAAGVITPIAGTTIPDGNAVEDRFLVHNGCMIWRASVDTGAQGLFATCFDATGNLGTIELTQSVLDSLAVGVSPWAGTFPDFPLPANVYGDDHGLTSIYAVYPVFRKGPTMLAASKLDVDVTFEQTAREIEQIDADNGVGVELFSGEKNQWSPESRISRTSSWIFVSFLQGTLPAQLAGSIGGTRFVRMHGIQTRTSATARTLANSLVTGGPFLAPNEVANVSNGSGRLFVQEELANGMEDPLCGIQSNVNRINLAWHEQTGVLIDLRHNGLTIIPSASAGVAPTGGPSLPSGGLITTIHEGWAFESTVQNVVTDLGNAAGDPLVYFVSNANNPLDNSVVGSFQERRVFGLAATAAATPLDAELVSTDGPNADQTLNSAIDTQNAIDDYDSDGSHYLRVKTTPSSRSASAHGGVRVHLFWRELRAGTNSKAAFVTRFFNKTGFNGGSSFTASHVPSLAAAPRSLGGLANGEEFLPPTVHPDGQEKGPFTPFCTAAGNTVGIYFTTTAHFWYQEFDGSSWFDLPEIIDNDSPASIFYGRDQRAYAFPPMLLNTCDNLNGTILFYAKDPPGEDPGHRRQWVRVRD
jgi:hypothetical protein